MDRKLIIGLSLLAAAIFPALGRGEEVDRLFRQAKAKLILELRSPKAEIRAAAVKKFEAFPTPDAAQTLLQQGAATTHPEIRRGCFTVLRSFGNHPEVAKYLGKEILSDLKRDKLSSEICVQFNCLLAAEEPATREIADGIVREAEKSMTGMLLLADVVDQLAELNDAESQAAVLRLADSAPVSSHSGFRRGVVQALAKMNRPEAVTALLNFYGAAEGETRADIERRLEQLSGLSAVNKPDWMQWWQDKGEGFEFPESTEKAELPPREVAAGGPSYYGLPLYGSRLVFVLDISGSMRGARLEAARGELLKAIRDLPDGVQFNVLAFNAVVIPWRRELVHASAATKEDAAKFVLAREAAANTASYDALEAALKCKADVIYFLTDGAPFGGKTSNPNEINALIGRANRLCRATINTIGIGGDHAEFLKPLAERNFGTYRELK